MTPLRWRLAFAPLLACGPAQPLADTGAAGPSSSGSTSITPDPTTLGPTTDPPSTTTSASPTTSTSTATTDGTTFIIKPDGGSQGELLCDTFAQDCPIGEKCTHWVDGGGGAWNATKCVEVTGTRRPGEACTTTEYGLSGIDDCEAGAMCWAVDEKGEGTCLAHCMGSDRAPSCPPGFVCEQNRMLAFCHEVCDPLLQDCEQADALCLPDQFSGTSYCLRDDSAIEGVANDPCKQLDDCEPGYYCLETPQASKACPQDFAGCCQPFCEYPGGACPNPDQKCRQWYEPSPELPPGAEKLGVCAIPA